MTPTLVFDIETVPDTDGLKKIYGLPTDTSAEDVARIAFHQRRQQNGTEFLAHHVQKVVAISCAMREGDSFRVWTLGAADAPEREIIQRFFDGIEKYKPNLVSWNGGGFDLPVLHYRGLMHGVQACCYWDLGDDDRDFKWNNYISRYHTRHLDLMDMMALYQPRANAPLDQIAQLCGFPGKLGMDGSKVWDAYCRGEIDAIRNYCETDVANTYLVYLRFQQMRGILHTDAYEAEADLVRKTLQAYNAPHWQEFLQAWSA